MTYVSEREVDRAMFNLYSMLDKLQCDLIDAEDAKAYEQAEDICNRIDKLETLISKAMTGRVKRSDWQQIQQVVYARETMRDEAVAHYRQRKDGD